MNGPAGTRPRMLRAPRRPKQYSSLILRPARHTPALSRERSTATAESRTITGSVWTKHERTGPTGTDVRNRVPKRASLECSFSRRLSHKAPPDGRCGRRTPESARSSGAVPFAGASRAICGTPAHAKPFVRQPRVEAIRALGDDAPTGPILGARVEHVGAKEALLADDPDAGDPGALGQDRDRGPQRGHRGGMVGPRTQTTRSRVPRHLTLNFPAKRSPVRACQVH